MAFLLTWKNVLPVLLKSANALLQVPHRNFLPGLWGDSPSRGPKQANRSSETARNFLRSAFSLLRFFPQTEHLKASFLPSIDTIIAIKTKYCSSGAILFSAITSLRLSGHAPAHAYFHPVFETSNFHPFSDGKWLYRLSWENQMFLFHLPTKAAPQFL